MKNINLCRLMILLISLVTVLCSCESDYEKQRRREKEAINEKIKEYADSIVTLSFYDITLNSPFKKTIKELQRNINIKKLTIKNNVANLQFLMKDAKDSRMEYKLNIEILSYQDTICQFTISTTNYSAHTYLQDLYFSKYNRDYSIAPKFGTNYELWEFKNQKIYLLVRTHDEIEYYLKDPKMRSFENKYGKKIHTYFDEMEIIYTDYSQMEKYDIYLKEEEARANATRKKEEKEKKGKEELERKRESEEKSKIMQQI